MFLNIALYTLVVGFLVVSPIYIIVLYATDGEGLLFIIFTILEFSTVALPIAAIAVYLVVLLGISVFK